MSNYEVAELIWENGQLAMHDLGGGIFPTPTAAPRLMWGPSGGAGAGAGDTLESVVHQATYCSKQSPNSNVDEAQEQEPRPNMRSIVASSAPKQKTTVPKKRSREPNDRESACVSGQANDNDTTMMTWASHDDDSENQEEGRETKSETERSYTTRKGRAAAVHNQSERKRRDRINQKMKTLQKLVPNANKTDKASMLDEVIDHLKQLQAQVQMMNNARLMPQLMMPIEIQQNLQMSLLARMGLGMGMGMGMGMLDTTSLAPAPTPTPTTPQAMIPHLIHPASTSGVVPPAAFVGPHMVGTQQPGFTTSGSLQDSYTALLAQTMNMELYNRMAALQRQQQQQLPQQMTAQPTNTQLQLNHQHAQRG